MASVFPMLEGPVPILPEVPLEPSEQVVAVLVELAAAAAELAAAA